MNTTERKTPLIIAVAGHKNTGKTTLLEKLIPRLSDRGISCAVIKHDGHLFEADREGTDTHRFLEAGAVGTAIFDREKFQLVRYCSAGPEELAACFPEADLIFLEGGKDSSFPKLELLRKGLSEEPFCDPKTVLARIDDLDEFAKTDTSPPVPRFRFEEAEALADFLTDYLHSH